jgi:hypothetical protein
MITKIAIMYSKGKIWLQKALTAFLRTSLKPWYFAIIQTINGKMTGKKKMLK